MSCFANCLLGPVNSAPKERRLFRVARGQWLAEELRKNKDQLLLQTAAFCELVSPIQVKIQLKIQSGLQSKRNDYQSGFI